MLLYHSTLQKTVRWHKKVGVYIMKILLSNVYHIYAKNTTKPVAKNMKDFRESIVTNLIGPPPPNHHLKPHPSTTSPLYSYTTNRKKEKCCQSMQQRTKRVGNGDRGCSFDISSSYFFRSSKVWSMLDHGSVEGASSE